MRIEIQLRIVGDDNSLISADEVLHFDKSDDRVEAIGLSFGNAKAVLAAIHAVVTLVEMQNLVRADHTVVVTKDPELDLDTHARPNGCRCSAASLSAADAANYPRSPRL